MKRYSAPLLTTLSWIALSWAVVARGEGTKGVKMNVQLNPMGSFVAESSALTGEAVLEGSAVSAHDVVLDLTTIKTGVDLRDKHMKEKYFETEKFPKAILEMASGKDGKFEGKLKVHGVESGISGTYTVTGHEVHSNFKTTLSDFKISKASYLGVGVENEVEVNVVIPLKVASAVTPAVKKATGH